MLSVYRPLFSLQRNSHYIPFQTITLARLLFHLSMATYVGLAVRNAEENTDRSIQERFKDSLPHYLGPHD